MTSYREYEEALLGVLWAWADRNHPQELDGGKRRGRPPVLAKRFQLRNILSSPDKSRATRMHAAIPRNRHRYFGSFKSSQALTISVFGAVKEYRRIDLLENVMSECGRQAFFRDSEEMNLEIEKRISWLGERRSTSVDVFLSGAQYRVAVECKFTEREFGACSRTRPRCRSSEYCDGNYRIQSGRTHRCALTEIGIRYWEYLPHLFHWPSDQDHNPCPFGSVYQLARNAMAASVMPDGRVDTAGGHVLVVYDARNPAFGEGRKARKKFARDQLETTEAACHVPGLVRRLSWQRLLTAISRAPELDYLVAGLAGKYGLKPE